MTTPHHTRIVLSEIPDGLESLRLATTPTTQLADEPTPANILNNTVPNNFHRLSYSTPNTSPDELLIRQRGRRRISLNWSPEKCPTSSRYPFEKTPTKCTSTMTLRSSPRKRLLEGNSFRTPEKSYNASPRKTDASLHERSSATPIMKRLKLEEKPLAQVATEIPLHVMLGGFGHDQLLGIIKNLIRNEPHLEERIRANLPMPDLGPLEDELIQLKRYIIRSLPQSRLIKKTDSVAYSRASAHMSAFKKTITSQSRNLYQSQHWDALIDYIIMAWRYVRSTPVWDNSSHNAVRRHCFKLLSSHCSAALRFGGHNLGQDRLNDLERESKDMAKDCDDILPVIEQLTLLLQNYQIN